MIKKFFTGMMMAASALFIASCASDDLTSSQKGGDATVSFSLALEGGLDTRAISDGTGADVLMYAVFNEAGERITTIEKVEKTGVTFPTVENITLAKGQTYQIAFWAQDDDCEAYTVSDDMNVSIDYAGVNNDETRDAFFKSIEFTVSGPASLDVVLKRPFAQINVGVYQEDWDAAVASGIEIGQSVAYIKNAATSINLLNGQVGEETTDVAVEYTAGAIPTETLMVDADKDGTKEAYKWLSMSYILVADHGTTPDAEGMYGAAATTLDDLGFSFIPNSGNTLDFKQGLRSVPVERNWRTNIIGKILTGDIEFNISIDPIYDGEYIYPDGLVQEILMAAAFGGTVTLTEDVTMPYAEIHVYKGMVINLNGHKLSCADETSLFRVEDGGSIIVNGDGIVDTKGYFSSANEGATVTINGGTFYCGWTCLQANGGKVFVKGGTFEVNKGDEGQTYTLNHVNAMKNVGLIEVTGGKFKNYDPSVSYGEQPPMNFVKEGYKSVKEGDYYVIYPAKDIDLYADYAEVYSAEGLLKWAYIANNQDNTLGLKVMNNITLPAFTIEADAANETYVFTSTPITVTDGKPSGSNWIPVRFPSESYKGQIEGNNNIISGLRIATNNNLTAFVGFMESGAYVKNITFNDAVVHSTDEYVAAAVGYSRNGTLIENVHVTNSCVTGSSNVGGVAGFNYRRYKPGLHEELAYVKDCTTDANTSVNGTGTQIGGICGGNYGAVMINCVNSADVTGVNHVGGVVGMSRDYYMNVNGYVVACGTTADATVTATSGNAGGIVGYSIKDNNHENSVSYIVACYSNSKVTASKAGTMIGSSTNGTVTASWAVKNGATDYAGYGTPTRTAALHYASANDITQADVDAMNAAISSYNATASVEAKCPYTWSWTAGNWPVLK